MKKLCSILLSAIILSLALLCTGCGANPDEAKTTLENYLAYIRNGEYESAYSLLSDFDKGNISKELFTEWRTAVTKLADIGKSSISPKIDRFKNFEYLGTTYQKAFGFEVTCSLKKKNENIKLENYDQETYKIMVVQEKGGYRVALLVTNLADVVSQYKDQIGR